MLGGTVFLGRHVVEALLARGHEPMLFTRGRRNPDLFPECERITGDRTTDLERIGARRFDAVVDTSGFLPAPVRDAAAYLAGRAERYVFVSSVSVYSAHVASPNEESELAALPAGVSSDEFAIEQYGALKALCEEAARTAFGSDRTIVVRPGLIVGPHDPTDRFTYWPCRLARGGDVLAPGRPDNPVQFVDVRDLATWMVSLLERPAAGTFDACAPRGAWTFDDVLRACRAAAQSDARLVWVEDAFLESAGIEPWMGLPLWLPPSAGAPGLLNVEASRAKQAGLVCRPLTETAFDTLQWAGAREPGHEWKAGIAPERESEVLAAWRERRRA
jgi:2'-hydroxyisoflavone reductase